MNAIRVMHIGVPKVPQILVVMFVLQMGQQTRLSHAEQSQSADKELKKTSTIRKNFAISIFRFAPTFIVEISHLI